MQISPRSLCYTQVGLSSRMTDGSRARYLLIEVFASSIAAQPGPTLSSNGRAFSRELHLIYHEVRGHYHHDMPPAEGFNQQVVGRSDQGSLLHDLLFLSAD